jgi:hypothetical protein
MNLLVRGIPDDGASAKTVAVLRKALVCARFPTGEAPRRSKILKASNWCAAQRSPVRRAYELRANVTAYDPSYMAPRTTRPTWHPPSYLSGLAPELLALIARAGHCRFAGVARKRVRKA